MTRLPSPYPHQVVADWIAANDDNAHAPVLSVVKTPRNSIPVDGPSPFDYDVTTRRARRAQSEAIAIISHTIGAAIGRVVSNTMGSLHNHWHTRRLIQRMSYLTPRLLDDMGVPHDIQSRVRALHAHRQPHRFHLHF